VLIDLCELLTGQKDVLTKMMELSQEERLAILGGQADQLESVVRLELKELSKLGAIERKRTALHDTISNEFGLIGDEITISAIAERAEPDERETIKKLQTELTTLINRHTDLNNENRELIKAHLEYTESMLELMVDSEDPLNNFYGGDGKVAQDKKKTTGFFDGHA